MVARAEGSGRIGPDDEAMLRRLVGPATLARALRYAVTGAVISCTWDPDGTQAAGEVQGTAMVPYSASVRITRNAAGRLSALDGRCSCPVGHNCKHCVALLLASPSAPRRSLRVVADSPAPPSTTPATPAWELPLRAVLGAVQNTGRPPADEPARGLGGVALQFELVANRPAPGRRKMTGCPGIQLRPVMRSPSGNWVRSGISWSQLDYYRYGSEAPAGMSERLALLMELRALGLLAGRPWSSYGDDAVWLESIGSRRLWDLLRQAQELAVPLISAGRDASAVTVSADAADAVIDLTRDGSALHLRAQVRAGEAGIPLDSALLIGLPAHGLAWWSETPGGNRTPPLHLAPLSRPLTAEMARLARGGTVTVPPEDAERFERDLYPQLRRLVPFASSDGSVDLPAAADDGVVLTLTHGDGSSVTVGWSLRVGSGPERDLWDRPDPAATATISSATAVVAAMPGLVRATPWGPRLFAARLDGMAAVQFVTDLLPALEAIEGLTVEQRGSVPDYHEATTAPVVSLHGTESSNGDWFDLGVEVKVDGEDVPFQSLFVALAEGRSHLLLPSGTYFSLERAELRRLAELIAEARSLQDAPTGQVRLSRFQASLWEDLESLGAVSSQAGAWADAVRALGRGGSTVEHPVPTGLDATLRPYQLEGFRWLAALYEHRLGGILADDMGLGKTLQALALVCHVRERGLADAPFLVVAPTSVVGNWVSEAARFAPGLRTVGIAATDRRRGTSLAEEAAGAALVVTSYALFRLEYQAYEDLRWAGLLLDEAQFAKNPSSHNFQRARRLPVPFKLAMTGTPLENSLRELWALTAITAPGLFSRPERFAETYQVPIEKHRDAERLDQLRRRIGPLMLRRSKSQVAADLPDKQEQVLELDLDPRHRKLYDTYLQRERQKILGLLGNLDGNRFEIFRSLTLLRQASLDVSLVDPTRTTVPSAKLDALIEMLEDVVADGHRMLVFSQFTRFLSVARRRIETAGIDYCYLDGATKKRAAVLSEWRTGTAPVFLISLKAGGFGLNLTEADYCVLLDPWWNPATEAQAVDRAHRIGQTRKVMVYRLVAKDTIEEKVMALKARKAALFSSVMDAGGFESAALSAADVRALLE